MEPIVSIVDDDAAVRDSWAQLLAMHGYRTRQFPDSRSFLEGRESGRVGCILLDIRMPGMNGIELHNELRRTGHEEPVVFVTGHGDVRLAVEAMRAGAVNFLQKPCGEVELIKSVRDAITAKSALGDGSREPHDCERDDARAALARLTEREREILDYVSQGMTSKMIARRLGLSVRTIDAHRANMMMKTDTHNVVELVRIAFAANAPRLAAAGTRLPAT